jgi:hypothetical protein
MSQALPQSEEALDALVADVVDDFCLRRQCGENPCVEKYAARYPHAAAEIRRVLAAVDLLGVSGPGAAPGGQDLVDQSPDETPTLLPPCLGRYRVVALLGSGGFGVVFKGYDKVLQRDVAIKVPHRHRIARPEDLELYLEEARVLAHLHHPHIVPVYDADRTAGGLCFVVSRFIEGTDLGTRNQAGSRSRPPPSWWRGSPRPCTMPTGTAWSTAMSSRRTSCSTAPARRTSPTSA